MTGGNDVNDATKASADGVPGLVWVKSSLSFANSNCVEITRFGDVYVGVRDSKDPHGGILRFTPDEWAAFLGGVRNGKFDV